MPQKLKQVPTLPVGTGRRAKRTKLFAIGTLLVHNPGPFGAYTGSFRVLVGMQSLRTLFLLPCSAAGHHVSVIFPDLLPGCPLRIIRSIYSPDTNYVVFATGFPCPEAV